ncbi:MAG: transcriptional regulator NrdR [Candidatus Xenobia bacterium]
MHCPYCRWEESKVLDSRLTEEGACIRRRRECIRCGRRFTTYERFEELSPMVVKKDMRRERFERRKILDGLARACEKRPISMEQKEAIVDAIEREVRNRGESEVSTQQIGEMVMRHLKELDEVAYVRFASVYKEFTDRSSFLEELQHLESGRRKGNR